MVASAAARLAWVRADGFVSPRFLKNFDWLPNHDASHPRAKWKLRLKVVSGDMVAPGVWDSRELFTFAGNPDGTFTAATTSCLQRFRSAGGTSKGASCSQGFIADIYALND